MNRNACESYEVHISALMDGEAEPTDAMLVLDHLPGCEACQRFYQQVRELQKLVDARPVAPGSTEALEARAASSLVLQSGASAADDDAANHDFRSAKVVAMERPPRWVWGLAASLLVALGFGLGQGMSGALPSQQVGSDGEVVVQIASDEGHMSEERFVALTVELLRADRKYHRKMSEVLDEVQERHFRNMTDSELASYRDESPSATRSEEGEEGGFSEALQLSPLQGVY